MLALTCSNVVSEFRHKTCSAWSEAPSLLSIVVSLQRNERRYWVLTHLKILKNTLSQVCIYHRDLGGKVSIRLSCPVLADSLLLIWSSVSLLTALLLPKIPRFPADPPGVQKISFLISPRSCCYSGGLMCHTGQLCKAYHHPAFPKTAYCNSWLHADIVCIGEGLLFVDPKSWICSSLIADQQAIHYSIHQPLTRTIKTCIEILIDEYCWWMYRDLRF